MKTNKDIKYFTGRYKDYHWIVSNNYDLIFFVESIPEIVMNKHIIISSFDSGELPFSDEELKSDWIKIGALSYSPKVSDVKTLPFDENDEWYIYEERKILSEEIEVFINYGSFSLVESNIENEFLDPTWDKNLAQEQINYNNKLLERFWNQIICLNPESYIASGDNFIFVTKRRGLIEKIKGKIDTL